MHVVTCQHCHKEFDIETESIVALQTRSHFKCPCCTKLLPVAMLPRVETPAPPAVAPVVAATESPTEESTPIQTVTDQKAKVAAWKSVNRNLLVLGSAFLLILGGVGIYLATRPSGDSTEVKQDITEEIIRNQFFSGLVDGGEASMDALERVTHIEAHGPGYIGLSESLLTWDEARAFATEVGAELLAVESATERRAPWKDPSTDRLADFLRLRFPETTGYTTWIQQCTPIIPAPIGGRALEGRKANSYQFNPLQPKAGGYGEGRG